MKTFSFLLRTQWYYFFLIRQTSCFFLRERRERARELSISVLHLFNTLSRPIPKRVFQIHNILTCRIEIFNRGRVKTCFKVTCRNKLQKYIFFFAQILPRFHSNFAHFRPILALKKSADPRI